MSLLSAMHLLRRIDLGLIAVLAVCLLAAWPLLSRPGLPVETDAELHVYRTAELDHLLQGGAVYPRWGPDFYFGYGYPLYNYYASSSYYLGAALARLPMVDIALATKLVFVVGLVGAGYGMYLFARSALGGPRPALVATIAYLLAPFLHFIEPYARGDLAEALSLGLLPWVLWAFLGPNSRRAPVTRRWWPLAAALLLATLIFTHNLMALVCTALLAAWLVWRALIRPGGRVSNGSHVRRSFLALILGIGLAAFFWLPVALERGEVQLNNLVSDGGHFDFRTHFLSLSELLRPTELLDLGATEPRYAHNLGPAQWAMALLGLAGLYGWRRRGFADAHERIAWWDSVFFGLAALILLALLLPLSEPVWVRVPLLPFLQFPWRLLGPLALCLAFLAGSGVAWLERILDSRLADWVTAVLCFVTVMLALPLTYPPEWPAEFGPTDPWGMMQNELSGRWLGTTSTGDFLPIGVASLPRRSEQILAAYRGGGPIDRVNRAKLPAGTVIELEDERPLAWSFGIQAGAPFDLELLHFWFPGWQARLNKVEVPIRPSGSEGLMTIAIPAGHHLLEVSFRDTAARTAAWVVSGVALALGLILTRLPPTAEPSRPGRHPLAWGVALVPVGLLVFKVAVSDPLGWFRLRSEGMTVVRAEHNVSFVFGDQIALIGYDWQPAGRGETAELVLYWKAVEPVQEYYQVFVHLRDSGGSVVAQSDKLNPGDYPTKRWPLDRYVWDRHRLTIPADLASGEYRLAVGLWLMAADERLEVSDPAGNCLGDSAVLMVLDY